jgi:nitrogen fixation NifU-like protein
MSNLAALYQEVILDHSKNPRNYAQCDPHSHTAEGYNPICGDQLQLYLQVNDDEIIEKATFTGEGCAISTASSSLMTEIIQGKTVAEAKQLFQKFQKLLTDDSYHEDLGKLSILEGVKEFPMRVKCATLAWHTLQSALDSSNQFVTTE